MSLQRRLERLEAQTTRKRGTLATLMECARGQASWGDYSFEPWLMDLHREAIQRGALDRGKAALRQMYPGRYP